MNDRIAKFLGVSGTVGNRTYANGKRRRFHSRNRRGTFKPAIPNSVLASNADVTAYLNAVRSSVYRVINMHWKDIRESSLWAKMLSRMRKSDEKDDLSLLASFIGLNFHKRYPLDG